MARTPQQRAKAAGKAWEREVAKKKGGVRTWAGPGLDVRAGELVIECKSRQDDDGLKLLVEWIEQARKYSENWALAIKLGKGRGALKLMVYPFERETDKDDA